MRGSYIPLRTVGFRISVDTGGTFTDVVVADEEGRLRIGKALTTRERAFDAIAEGLAQIAPELGLEVGQLLAQADVLTYGTTRATNAIVEGTTARTAFFTTEGFPDVLLLREGGKHDPFGQQAYGPPYVPRFLTFEISERMDSEGQPFAPLEEASVARAIEAARGLRAEAVAVCLLWSIVNPAHELRVGELLDELWPGVPYTLSHRLNPIIREYRRASSTAIDASLKPLMQEYLATMERDLRQAGFAGHLFVSTSFGGAWRPHEVVERPDLLGRLGPLDGSGRRGHLRARGARTSARATSSSATRAGRPSTSGSSRAARSARPPRRGSAGAGSATSRASARSTSSRSERAAARSSGSTPEGCFASGRAAPGPIRGRPATGAAASSRP